MHRSITPLRALVALSAVAAACVLPPSALADDFCVGRAGCDAAHSYPASGLQAALDAARAKPDPDRVLLGPGHFPSASYLGPAVGGAIEIAGSGADQTIIDTATFGLFATGHGVSVHDLGVDIAAGGTPVGLISDGSVSSVAVTGGPSSPGAVGMLLGTDASVDHAQVRLPAGGTGVRINDNVSVTDSTIDVGRDGPSSTGIEVSGSPILAPISLKRLRISAKDPLDVSIGTVQIADSLLDLGAAPNGTGIFVHSDVNGPMALVSADRVTIAGHGEVAGMQTGIRAESSGVGAVVGINLENSIVSNVRYMAIRLASPGYAAMGLHHTVYTPGELFIDQNTASGTGALQQDAVTPGDPGFVDAAHGDYRLRFDSQLIDRATPAVIASGPTDLAGGLRLVDGNGDGSVLADLGAFEYQRRAPVVTTASAVTGTVGQPVILSATALDPDGDQLPAGTWSFGDGAGANGAGTSHVYGTPGAYVATFSVADPTGLSTTSSVNVSVSAPVAPVAPAAPVALAGGVATPLTLSGLHLTPSRFRHAAFLPGKARSAHGGTTISVRSSAAAMLTLRLVGKHGRTAGLLHLKAHAGTNTIRFGGRLSSRSGLRAGSYVLTVSAASATPLKARLTVLR